MSTEKPVQLVEVELAGEHTHKGVDYKAGDTIKVTKRQKLFLEQSGKIGAVVLNQASPATIKE
ncbi:MULTISPECIES: DUF7210 family protein [Pseudomonas]|jgi:hypothetical protein|uniref:DUF7210 family protein n=1 Tax=Pseudomonas TaxID=286 RepID=UPI000396417A|nr:MULTISPECIES: hypothetical protein [Pseudomonas]EQM71313.1 hypothetical protein L682_31025 [Pseudomonas alcaligenes OT 69]MBB4817123.1 hypothetical protein [Pseudomonas alcaligenes]MDN4149753.1 hypothetical protein [Pseudomonas tohonis]WCD79150.1 hypothetical protein PI990_24615 [Pseudomonas sp. TUM22785]